MRVTNTDAASNVTNTQEKRLDIKDQDKRRKYLDTCLHQWHYFPPFFSEDSLICTKAEAILKRLTSRLATKWRKPYYRACGYVRNRISITIVGATHHCIRGSQVPEIRISVHWPQWEGVSGINLYR